MRSEAQWGNYDKNKMDVLSSGSEEQDVRMVTKKQNVEIGWRDRIRGKDAYLPG